MIITGRRLLGKKLIRGEDGMFRTAAAKDYLRNRRVSVRSCLQIIYLVYAHVNGIKEEATIFCRCQLAVQMASGCRKDRLANELYVTKIPSLQRGIAAAYAYKGLRSSLKSVLSSFSHSLEHVQVMHAMDV